MLKRVLASLLWLAVALPASAQGGLSPDERARAQARANAELIRVVEGAPARIAIEDQATLRLVDAFQFVPLDAARRHLQAFDRYVPDDLFGMLIQSGRDDWYATIRVQKGGFVDSNPIAKVEIDDLLLSMKNAIEAGNKDRIARDWLAREVTGWLLPFKHDRDARAFVWAVLSPTVGSFRDRDQITSVHIVVFGREARIAVEIVATAAEIRTNPQDIATILEYLRFVEGKRYEDFVPARDPVSPDGLLPILGVSRLETAGAIDGWFSGDMLVVMSLGGFLVVGGSAMGIVLFIGDRRSRAARNRRGGRARSKRPP